MTHARNGFLVAADKRHRVVTQVSIKSLLGNPRRLQNPWPETGLSATNCDTRRTVESGAETGDILCSDTRANREYLIVANTAQPTALPAVSASEPNDKAPKKFIRARMLGLEKALAE